LFCRFKNAKNLETEVTSKLLVLKEQHHVTEDIIKKVIEKQYEHTYGNISFKTDFKFI